MTVKELHEWLSYLPEDFKILTDRQGIVFELQNEDIYVDAKRREVVL